MDAKFYVPYETAQLLKEKGYDAETDYYYSKETKSITPLHDLKNEWYPDSLQIIIDTRYILAPTYHEVLDWLFDRGVSIWARSNYGKIDWFPVVSVGDNEYFPSGWFKTREEALNKAILEAIRLYI